MADEFVGRDLRDATFWDVDLRRARFRDVDLSGVTVSHARLEDVDIDGFVERVTINGVDVSPYVNERDPWYPLRALIRSSSPDGMRAAWDALEQTWAETLDRAGRLGEWRLHESVGGEWSFVSTLRHLVFAADKWFTLPILGREAFHALGVPNSGSADFDWPGLDRHADPGLDEVLAVRAEQAGDLRAYLRSLPETELAREVTVLENGRASIAHCLYTVFEEHFHHNRYARRDLAQLE